MKRALVARTIAEKCHGHPIFAVLLGGKGGTACWRQTGADDAAATEFVAWIKQVHVAALAAPEPGVLAKHLSRHGFEGNALGDGEVVRPVGSDHRIFLAQVGANPYCHRLLAG